MLDPKASSREIHATFRRYVARYRPLITVPQLLGDSRFRDAINAYLVLQGPLRSQYDALLHAGNATILPPALQGQLEALGETERSLLVARIAIWRREMTEATHILRLTVERHPECATAWSLEGELHLTFGRLPEAIKSYQRAINLDANNPEYSKRLQHIQQVVDGKVELQLEASPAEEMLREERLRRWRFTALLSFFGLSVLVFAFVTLKALLVHPHALESTFLNIPWHTVLLLAIGVMLLLAGLAYGRLIRPFEQEMVWSTMSAVERGMVTTYPLGLILLVLSVASLWLAVLGFVLVALMEDDWPYSSLIMLGVAALATIGLGILLGTHHHTYGIALIFGGNPLCLAGILGWWVGSMGMTEE